MGWPSITVGLPRPEKEAVTPDEMRREIERASRDSSLIRNVLDLRSYRGHSGEDTYVILAYRALRMLEQQYQANLKWMSCSLHPSFVVKDPSAP